MSKQKQAQLPKVNKPQQGVPIKLPVCHRKNCLHKNGPVIKDLCYVFVQPALIIQRYLGEIPPIFKSAEHAANYNVGMSFHSECWQAELRDHGVKLFDVSPKPRIQHPAIFNAETQKSRPRVGQPARRQKKKKR